MAAFQRDRAAAAWVGVACLVLVFEAATLPARLNCDVAMYLETGKLLLEGKTPYVDFDDINLPFVMHVSSAFVGIARRLHLPLIPFFQTAVALLAIASALATAHAAKARLRLSFVGTAFVAFALVAVSWSWFYTIEAGSTMSHFAQREHLFALAYLPSFARRWAQERGYSPGRSSRAILGILLGVATMLKPHFALVVALTEAYWAVRARTARALLSLETAFFVASAVCFTVIVAARTPRVAWREYFLRWAPLIRRSYEDSYGVPLSQILIYGSVLVPIVVLVLLVSRWGRLVDVRDWAVPLALGIGLVLVQHKPWAYQRIPMISAAVLVVALAAVAPRGSAAPARGTGRAREAWLLATCIFASTILVLSAVRARSSDLSRKDTQIFARTVLDLIERRSDQGDGVLFLTSAPYPAYPALLLAGSAPGSRYLWTFPIALIHPRFVETGPPRESPGDPDEMRFLDELDEDIRIRKPALIFVEHTVPGWGLPAGWSIERYIRTTRVFRTIESGYRRHADLEELDVWERAPAG